MHDHVAYLSPLAGANLSQSSAIGVSGHVVSHLGHCKQPKVDSCHVCYVPITQEAGSVHYIPNDGQVLMYPPHNIVRFGSVRNVTLDNKTTCAMSCKMLKLFSLNYTLARQHHSARHTLSFQILRGHPNHNNTYHIYVACAGMIGSMLGKLYLWRISRTLPL